MADDYVQFGEGVILLDRLGSAMAFTTPHGELAVMLDIGGRLNKQTEDVEHRFLMRPEQAAELIADLSLTLGQVENYEEILAAAFEHAKERQQHGD